MQINPGGRLRPEDVLGRDAFIERAWTILNRQGLILTGERRIGKSHILWKMHEEDRPGVATIYQDLEGVHNTCELVRSIYKSIADEIPTRKRRFQTKFIELWDGLVPKRFGELELPNADHNWKTLVTSAFADAAKVPDDSKLVLFWDEFPLMIYNIAKTEGAPRAMELLDLLRQLRQRHASSLRFILTGSIGLNLVLKSLRSEGHLNPSVNDMYQLSVPPLTQEASVDLCAKLLSNTKHPPNESHALAQHVYTQVGGFPYYIHHVADQLSLIGHPATETDVLAAVNDIVAGDTDPAHLAYYVDRINSYYSPDDSRCAFAVLDALARSEVPMTLTAIIATVSTAAATFTDEHIRSACQLLRTDHYVHMSHSEPSTYSFSWPLLRTWWRRTRT